MYLTMIATLFCPYEPTLPGYSIMTAETPLPLIGAILGGVGLIWQDSQRLATPACDFRR
jgi:hypothetical protein